MVFFNLFITKTRLIPIQDVKNVAKKTIQAIYMKSEEEFVPWYIQILAIFYYVAPIWLRDPINSWQSNFLYIISK